MKLNKMILAAAAVVLPLSIGAGSALAYFTDNVSSLCSNPCIPITIKFLSDRKQPSQAL